MTGDPRPKFVDASKHLVEQAVFAGLEDAELVETLKQRAIARVESRLGARPPRSVERLEGQAATAAVREWRESAEANLGAVAQRRTHAEWLWLLRRIGGAFALNDLSSTEPYCRALAEIAAAMSSKADASGVSANHQLSNRLVRDFMLLWSAVAVCYDVHSTQRWAAKGAAVEFSRATIPRARPDHDLKAAVNLYDRRHSEYSQSALVKAGSGMSLSLGDPIPDTLAIPLLFDLPEQGDIPLPGAQWDIVGEYVPGLIDLMSVRGMRYSLENHPGEIWDGYSSAALAIALTLYPMLLEAADDETPASALHNIASVGYEVSHDRRVQTRLGWALHSRESLPFPVPESTWPTSARHALSVLSERRGTIWPPRGGRVATLAGDFWIIDWVALRRQTLEIVRRIAPDGPVANEWGYGFEAEVQEQIDSTAWKPAGVTRGLIGRTLRREGDALTDIDAVAEQDGTLLLVSCKSYAYTDEYDRGDFATTRNTRQKAERAVDDHVVLVEQLRQHPVGDNFDLSRYTRLEGLVVTPFVPFVSLSYLTLDEAGLPLLAAIAELDAILT